MTYAKRRLPHSSMRSTSPPFFTTRSEKRLIISARALSSSAGSSTYMTSYWFMLIHLLMDFGHELFVVARMRQSIFYHGGATFSTQIC